MTAAVVGLAASLSACAQAPDTQQDPDAEQTPPSQQAPTIQTEGTLIYLADNLDEEAGLGWCIDTVGRGQSDQLHAHSCKPTGGDVQFSFDADTGHIESVEYGGLCMAYSDPENVEVPFGLLDCVDDEPTQRFAYDSDTMEIKYGADPPQCVTVAETIDDAGPYQSRDLIMAACADLPASFKQWVIRA
ncbi:ricin-type beta-trefoil lectin domain protein [Rubrivirga sp. S365]|uniref:ricin-type beta-trefoil lectin domain protein n=1 Tax=Rubrivirga sp. S365 TaxID=3076080 RepID=UPI0028C643CA|nr:ricin-type beta-trefoil lectin domain protein [Rubrivirga sp. S365]MDT7858352.1 ricin-type beta-trefoil lectin domain protein [Rubrivirga sp. S365]